MGTDKTITGVKIEVAGTITVSLTQDDIKKIVEHHNGDYQSYVQRIGISTCDISGISVDESHNREYDKYIIEDAIAKYHLHINKTDAEKKETKHPDFYELLLEKYTISKEKFHSIFCDNDIISPDRKTLGFVALSADHNNPKHELDCVYLKNNDICATDTRILIKAESEQFFTKNEIFIPKPFALAYSKNEKAELFHKDGTIGLKTDDFLYVHELKGFWKFPDYNRIIPKSIKHIFNKERFEGSSFFVKDENDFMQTDGLLCVYNKDEFVFIDGERYLQISSYFEDKDCSFGYNDNTLPVMFSTDDVKIVMMPLIISHDEVVYKNARRLFEKTK